MKHSPVLFLLLSLACSILASCDDSIAQTTKGKHPDSGRMSGDLLIYAAASLTDTIREIGANFKKEHPDLKVNISAGSSAQLAKQIAHGAPADVFLSANVEWMDYLEDKGLILETHFEPLGNRLVIITNINNKEPIRSIQDLMTDRTKYLAIADYNSAPAGIYAKQAFERLNIWQNIQSMLVVGDDVRQTMTYVERNEAEYGIVYETDAKVSKKVKYLFPLPEDSQPKIRYSFGAIKGSPNAAAANAFCAYIIKDDSSRNVFKKYGFEWLLE